MNTGLVIVAIISIVLWGSSIMYKIQHERNEAAVIDIVIMFLLMWLMAKTFSGIVAASVIAMLISLAILINPKSITKWFEDEEGGV